MKILVVGASQGTGAQVVLRALEKGHEVTAFSRSPQKLTVQHERLTRLPGDFHNAAQVDAAVKGQDAVIMTASVGKLSQFKEQPDFFSRGSTLVVESMKRHGVKRLCVLSALGVGESRKLLPWPARVLLVGLILKAAFEDHAREEALLRQSGLEWVVARPGRLTDGPARHAYQKTAELKPLPSAISRADVADFLVAACEDATWVHKAVHLGG
jgi:putative NADH-flavin reductase